MLRQRIASLLGPALRAAAIASIAAGALATTAAREVVAQEADGRWLAWMGCWQPVQTSSSSSSSTTAMLCIQPSGDEGGVELVSVEDGAVKAREALRADGSAQDVGAGGCEGIQRARFSSRPGRVYMESDVVCEGGVEQTSSGLFAMISTDSWVDARVVATGGEKSAWVTRYRLATQSKADEAGFGNIAAGLDMAVRSQRLAAAGEYLIDDVIEATEHVAPEAVHAWVAEHENAVEVNSDRLVRLADAGVPEEIIDMMIARSYPEKFALKSEVEDSRYGYGGYAGLYGPSPWLHRPFGYFGFDYGYSPYGYGYGYNPYRYGSIYSPYGYGYRPYGYGYGGGIVRIDGRDGGGRVIAGKGYRSSNRPQPVNSAGSGQRGQTSTVGSSSGRQSTGRTARRRGGGGL